MRTPVVLPRMLAGSAWMVLAQALFSVMNVGSRLSARGVPWQEIACVRFVVGAITALLVARIGRKSLRITNPKLAWARTGFGTLAAIGTFYTLASPAIAVGDAVTLLLTSPIFVVLLSWTVLGEPVSRAVIGVVAVSFGGVIAVAHPTFESAGWLVASGTSAAMASAMAMVYLRKVGSHETSEAIVFHFSAVASVVLFALAWSVWTIPDIKSTVVLLVTGTSAGLAQLAMTRAYTLGGAARISALSYLSLVFTRLLALLIFDERPSVGQILGSLLVIAAGVTLALRDRPASPVLAAPGE